MIYGVLEELSEGPGSVSVTTATKLLRGAVEELARGATRVPKVTLF